MKESSPFERVGSAGAGSAQRILVEPVFEPGPEARKRLTRLRRVAWLMDRSIAFGPGGRWRIGLDPLLGLIPGLGDWLGAGVSLWMLYEATRLGLRWSILTRMAGNILVEAIVGSVPILGDLFDAAWQANQRNWRLVERHFSATLRPRPMRRIFWAFALVGGLFLFGLAVLVFVVARGVIMLFGA